MALIRNFIFRNNKAYDIYRTIVTLLSREPNHGVAQCVERLINMQYEAGLEDFLYDLDVTMDDNQAPPLVYLDIWLASYGVEAIFGSSDNGLDDGDEVSVATIDLPCGLTFEENVSDDEMSAVASLLGIRDPNLMVLRSAYHLANSIPPTVGYDPEPEEQMSDDESEWEPEVDEDFCQ